MYSATMLTGTRLTGTISDLDPQGLFGVIDADDGRLVLFNLNSVEPCSREAFQVGTRVGFLEQPDGLAPRALALSRIVSA
ncbi:MAG TPA: hypothetical protein VHB68_08970 [Steroidobacteraceae bacterium]|nr:hypothetical protein [Steroidobacteraceae bacterium]